MQYIIICNIINCFRIYWYTIIAYATMPVRIHCSYSTCELFLDPTLPPQCLLNGDNTLSVLWALSALVFRHIATYVWLFANRPGNTLLRKFLAHNIRSVLHHCFHPLTKPSSQAVWLVTPVCSYEVLGLHALSTLSTR